MEGERRDRGIGEEEEVEGITIGVDRVLEDVKAVVGMDVVRRRGRGVVGPDLFMVGTSDEVEGIEVGH